MSPEVSRRLGLILGRHWVSPDERDRVISASLDAERWEDVPKDVRGLLREIGRRSATGPGVRRARHDDPDAEIEEIARALATLTDDEFEQYWTRGEGLGRWATHPHPWRTLRRLLQEIRVKHGRGPRDPEGLASHYFKVVFGIWPGERKGDNPVGPG